MYVSANSFVKTLLKDTDYKIDEKDNQISLTDEGVAQCEQYFDIQNFSDPDNMELNHYVNQALRANYLMKRDVDYIVQDGEILIVDEFTGRLMYGRRFSNGLHQAIEAKEGVNIRAESKTLATITLQNYFRMYQKLSGNDRYGEDRGRRVPGYLQHGRCGHSRPTCRLPVWTSRMRCTLTNPENMRPS